MASSTNSTGIYQSFSTVFDSSKSTSERFKAGVEIADTVQTAYNTYQNAKPYIEAAGEHISMRAHRANELEHKNQKAGLLDRASKQAYEAVYGPMPPPPKNCCDGCCIIM